MLSQSVSQSVSERGQLLFYLMSRLVSRPPLGGPDWSEPGRGRGLPGSGGCGVINWDDWLVVQSASQPVSQSEIEIF